MITSKNKILITKKKLEVGNAFTELENKGNHIYYFPTIEIIPMQDYSNLDYQIREIETYDYIVFTSRNSVKFFLERIKLYEKNINSLTIIAVGSKTAEILNTNQIKVDFFPKEFSSKGIIKELDLNKFRNKKVLIPTSNISEKILYKELISYGAEVLQIPVYDVRIPQTNCYYDEKKIIEKNPPNIIAFTSPSNFLNYIKIFSIDNLNSYFSDKIIVAIGTITENKIKSFGLKVSIVGKPFTVKALAKEIEKFIERKY